MSRFVAVAFLLVLCLCFTLWAPLHPGKPSYTPVYEYSIKLYCTLMSYASPYRAYRTLHSSELYRNDMMNAGMPMPMVWATKSVPCDGQYTFNRVDSVNAPMVRMRKCSDGQNEKMLRWSEWENAPMVRMRKCSDGQNEKILAFLLSLSLSSFSML